MFFIGFSISDGRISDEIIKIANMKRQRITKGSILQIPVEDYYCYAQILEKANYAFFNRPLT